MIFPAKIKLIFLSPPKYPGWLSHVSSRWRIIQVKVKFEFLTFCLNLYKGWESYTELKCMYVIWLEKNKFILYLQLCVGVGGGEIGSR